MQIIFDLFNFLFFAPTVNLLVLILHALNFLNIPGALGFAIIILTILIRLLVWPLMSSQLKSVQKMAQLKPHLDELKKKHKDDKMALVQAQNALYKEHGVNPAGGCLPTLIQFPVLIALYQTIFAFFSEGEGLSKINNILYGPIPHLEAAPDLSFFGLNLAIKPDAGALILIPLFTAALTFIQSKMMTPKPVQEYPGDKPKEKKEKESMEDSMAAVQTQMAYMMPIMFGYFAFQFPLGLSLYWNTLTVFSILQQYRIGGWGGLDGWIKKIRR